MSKTLELLLTETVDTLGIVGDVVKVRSGFARNYLLPRGLATQPSDEAIQALAAKRAEAEKKLRELRSQREAMIEKVASHEVHIKRACNDQGLLYGSVTQRDIADAFIADGFNIKPRDVRLGQTIKRVDSYPVLIKLDQDLEATVKVWVVPDRDIQVEDRDEMEFDNEGDLIEKPRKAPRPEGEAADAETGAEKDAKPRGARRRAAPAAE